MQQSDLSNLASVVPEIGLHVVYSTLEFRRKAASTIEGLVVCGIECTYFLKKQGSW